MEENVEEDDDDSVQFLPASTAVAAAAAASPENPLMLSAKQQALKKPKLSESPHMHSSGLMQVQYTKNNKNYMKCMITLPSGEPCEWSGYDAKVCFCVCVHVQMQLTLLTQSHITKKHPFSLAEFTKASRGRVVGAVECLNL
jgi:hypothetical protein